MRLLLCLLFLGSLTAAGQSVTLTGLLDGTLSGATPRAVELYVSGTVDLATYTLDRYSNGGTTPTSIALSGTYTDAFVYVVNDAAAFGEAFGAAGGFANLIVSGSVSGNGNDAFALVAAGTIVDVVGGPIGGPAEDIYLDSYLYRKENTAPTGAWSAADWNIPGNDVLDGLTAAEIGTTVPFGTYRAGEAGPMVSVTTANLDEADAAVTATQTFTLSAATPDGLRLAYTLGGSATEGVDYTVATPDDTLRFPAGATEATLVFAVIDDETIEGTEEVTLRFTYLSDSSYTVPASVTFDIRDDDLGTDPIGIHLVQGNGFTSPLAGNPVTVEGIVTAVFADGIDGFYVQEEDDDADDDPRTSEGIFVYAPENEVAVGDRVRVRGEAEEYFGQTQLDGGDAGATVTVLESGVPLPAPTVLLLPLPDSSLESLEGMRIQPQDLVITSVDNLARFGELTVTSGERLAQFTECNTPDAAAYTAYLDSLAQDVLILDDARNGSNQQPIYLPDGSVLSAGNAVRAGQTVSGLTGILSYGFDRYRIQPTDRSAVTLTGNERPTAAPDMTGNVRVVTANVLNYFTTIDSRGADSNSELLRQEAKIVAALAELDADVVGLIEIENNDNLALQRLVDTLNVRSTRGYGYVLNPEPGDDEIMVALIYDTLRIEEAGTAAALTTPAELFTGPRTNRVPLAQSFRVNDAESPDAGKIFTVAVNHFKSKGSACGEGDDDGGGAGNCNGTRLAAATALADWLATDPTGVATENVLIIGDLNSYRMEAPIQELLAAGYVNTKTLKEGGFPCAGGPPSYVFGGYWGSLDYALASDSLARFVTSATAWTVNAPEAAVLDYNQEGASDTLYAADFYRFSDHDPIVVDLDFSQDVTSTSGPARGALPVELRRMDAHTYRIEGVNHPGRYFLTTVSGQVTARGTVDRHAANRISTAGLPAGVYFLSVSEPGFGRKSFKLLVN